MKQERNSTKRRKPQLRRDAEAQLARTPVSGAPECSSEQLLHELQVHPIEFEMQNEELRLPRTLEIPDIPGD